MAQLVRDLMVQPAVTVQSGTSLTEAARLMRDAEIGDIVVVDANRPVGVVTDRDIVVRGVTEGHPVDTMSVWEVCTKDVISVRPDDEVDDATDIMRRASVRRLPVVEGGKVVGVISLGDIAIDHDESSVLAEISSADANS